MIDIKNMTFDEAKNALNTIHLGIERDGEESSDTYAEGRIISQSEEKGTMLEENTTIKVVISTGVGEVPVPNVMGMDKATAETTLKAQGFYPSFDYDYSDQENDKVISQSPVGDTKAKKGETVTVILSRGKEPIRMPNVLRKPEADAKAELGALGLYVTSTTDYSDDVPEGYVIWQSEEEGRMLEEKSAVTICISLGKKITTLYYSLDGYEIQKLDEIPEDVISVQATITLFKAEGNDVINSWTASTFPFTVSQGNIENCDVGYFVIEWEWKYEEEDGSIITEGTETYIENVTFTPNQ